MKISNGIFIVGFLFSLHVSAQFPPSAGQAGSTAIRNDSSAIVAWATGCSVVRGFMDISIPDGGFAEAGSIDNTLGFAEGNPVKTLSLGDAGEATLTFAYPVSNGSGPDFAVFENGFDDHFLELAFVEVSSDGHSFFRFPSFSNTDTSSQIPTFGTMDPTRIHNLAGKYRAGFGTPFDLSELGNPAGLNLNRITHIKIIDVVGSIMPEFASRDSQGRIVNDPFPTPFPTGGFDLDGIGVIHQETNATEDFLSSLSIKVYPNPVFHSFRIEGTPSEVKNVILQATDGRRYCLKPGVQGHYSVSALAAGLYILTPELPGTFLPVKILIYQ